ncbi:MAG: hypothetical protein PHE89_02715 [Alphaproteobacteria bacterium]|nr:hypothetical protein [Alphaproteobacteria bacterium]
MIKVNSVEEVKAFLEWACEVHRTIPQVRAKDSRKSILGDLLPSHVWSQDADDAQQVFLSSDVDKMWFIFDNWFVGLSRRQKIVVLLRCGVWGKKLGFKSISWALQDKYGFSSGIGRTTVSNDFEKGLLKIYGNAR